MQALSRFGVELSTAQSELLFDRYDTLGDGGVNFVALVRDATLTLAPNPKPNPNHHPTPNPVALPLTRCATSTRTRTSQRGRRATTYSRRTRTSPAR